MGVKLLRQFRKGAWTNDPNDPNYQNHWNASPLQPNEHVERVVPGYATPTTRSAPGLSNLVNVRLTDQGGVYVDTPSVEKIGALGSLAGFALRRGGLDEPRHYEASEVNLTDSGPNRVAIDTPALRIQGKTDQHVGRVGDLPPKDQLKNLWTLLRG